MSENKEIENANNQNEIVSSEITALDVAKYLIGLSRRDANHITNLILHANNQNEIVSSEITALDVAKYLIGLAQRDGNPITNLRLQKLLYYAWGYYWNSFKQYLFKDDIEAWRYGPVIKDVYDEYKIFDGGDIIIDENIIKENKSKFNQQQQDFFYSFYNFMKKYDTWALVDASHKEKPWKETYNNGKQIISYELMKEEFTDDAFDEN